MIVEPQSEEDPYGNFELAKMLVEKFLQLCGEEDSLKHFDRSDMLHVLRTQLPGRFERSSLYNHAWTLDVAHNAMSLDEAGGKWAMEARRAVNR